MRSLLRFARPFGVPSGLALALSFAAPASAADGVLEINQTCATQSGCFAGDSGGWPVTITSDAPARSFRLTSDLVIGSADTTAIHVSTHALKIDLGGFTIRGPVSCTGTPTVCTPPGAGDGITVPGVNVRGIEVRNGAVTGMGRHAVYLGDGAVVEGVRAIGNGGAGIQTYRASTIRSSVAASNGTYGIATGHASVVEGCTAFQNGLDGLYSNQATFVGNATRENGRYGIWAQPGSVVSNNVVDGNADSGINASISTISGNAVYNNDSDGIRCGGSCVVTGNNVVNNGQDALDDGIDVDTGIVQSNSSGSNFGFGLRLGTNAGYRESTMLSNGTGGVFGGTNLGNNRCVGTGVASATCP
jgi:hypothetical protein